MVKIIKGSRFYARSDNSILLYRYYYCGGKMLLLSIVDCDLCYLVNNIIYLRIMYCIYYIVIVVLDDDGINRTSRIYTNTIQCTL